MRLSSTAFQTFFRPEECSRRVYLRSKNEPEAEPGAYVEVLRELGKRLEVAHLAQFRSVTDLSGLNAEEREAKTIDAIKAKSPVIYQPRFRTVKAIAGIDCEVVGEPDFLILDGTGYVIRDVKMSRRINEKDHPEILRQLELYGLLFSETVGSIPRLEVLNGRREIVSIPYDGGANCLGVLEQVVRIRLLKEKPYEPVGFSKCGPCGFKKTCWEDAEKSHDLAVINGVDQSLAKTLKGIGVDTYDQLVSAFDEVKLAEVQKLSLIHI